jgi:cell division protein FtsN
MAKDFAKRTATPAPADSNGGGGVKIAWFASGMLVGVFASFLFYLWQFVPADPSAGADTPTAQVISDKEIIEMDYDFYDLFPSAEVPVVEEYSASGKKVVVEEEFAYLLQAGSFRKKEDADRLRGELILQGLDVFVRSVEQSSGAWHRVMVGPFDTKLALNRTRNILAEADIESIQLRVKR